MKKITGIIIFIILLCSTCQFATAKTIGEVLTTDIGAFIDHQPIESFNINGFTYVIAEDLRSYGFDVFWNGEERSLKVSRNPEAPRNLLPVEKVNRLKNEIPFRQKVFDVYDTDIKTYLNNELVNAYNVDGKTLIQIDELSECGYFSYNNEERQVSIDMLRYDLDNAFHAADKDTLVLSDGITYEGEVKNGQPNGIGKKFVNTVQKEFPGDVTKMTYFGYFKDGQLDGNVISEGTVQPTIGSFKKVIPYQQYAHYKDGKLEGFCYSQSDRYAHIREDSTYVNGIKNGLCRESEYNSDYIYGYRIGMEGVYDNGNVIDYQPMDVENLRFSAVAAASGVVSAVTDEGLMFLWGDGKKNLPVYGRYNVKSGAGEDNTLVLARDHKLYQMEGDVDTNDICIAENVAWAETRNYLDTNGTLWEDAFDGNGYYKVSEDVKQFDSYAGSLLILKKDGSVWWMRSKPAPGVSYNDGLDLSTPVKVMEDAKYVSVYGATCLVVKNDNSVWGWGFSINGELGVYTADDGTYDTAKANEVKTPIKAADGFVKVSIHGGTVLAQKDDGSLWGWGDNKSGQLCNGNTQNSLTPVKIMDNVKDFSVGYGFALAIKEDGSLWAWGRNDKGQLGIGNNESSAVPIQITKVYRAKKIFF